MLGKGKSNILTFKLKEAFVVLGICNFKSLTLYESPYLSVKYCILIVQGWKLVTNFPTFHMHVFVMLTQHGQQRDLSMKLMLVWNVICLPGKHSIK